MSPVADQRQLSTAQPHVGLKGFSKSPTGSQQRSRQDPLNNTGFNWKKVSIKTNALEGTHRSGGQTYHVPK